MPIDDADIRPLARVFHSNHAKLLDALCVGYELPYDIKSLIRITGFSEQELNDLLSDLIKDDIISKSERGYEINKSSKRATDIMTLFTDTCLDNFDNISQ